ncbi:MAG: hypothetical protein ACOCO9_03175 [Segatella copri]
MNSPFFYSHRKRTIPEDVKVYAATADETQDSTAIIKNLTMTLTEVDVIKVINANKGYVVYGPVGTYAFHSTSRESNEATILKGNPTSEYIFRQQQRLRLVIQEYLGIRFLQVNRLAVFALPCVVATEHGEQA